jgi:hypothetical protein
MTYDPFDPFEEQPMYHDTFLRFTDEAEANEVLFDEQTVADGDVVETVKVPKYAAIDVIGVIYKPTGKMLKAKKGEEPAPEMKPLPGWHANVRHNAETPELAAYAVQPQQPTRGWA